MVVRSLLTVLGFDVDTKSVKKYNQALSNVVKTTGLLSTIAGGAITALGATFLKGAGEIEQVSIAFETMLGSAEKAATLLGDITQFAATTPFELTGLINSSKQLLAFGIDMQEIIPTMTTLGNIAAGIGRDKLPTLVSSLGKIRTKGKASMEELNMMLEAGVPILDMLSKNLNVTTQELFKMITAGTVSFDDVNKALYDMGNGTGQFANLMEKQSKSFLGLLSNIKDAVTNIVNEIGKELLPQGKDLARMTLSWIDANKDLVRVNVVEFFQKVLSAVKSVAEFMQRFSVIGTIGDVIKVVIGIFTLLGNTINQVFGKDGKTLIDTMAEWLSLNKELIATKITKFISGLNKVFKVLLTIVKDIWPVLVGVGAAFVVLNTAMKIAGIIQGLSTAFTTLKTALIAAATGQKALNLAMKANVIGIVITAIGVLISIIVLLVKNWDKIKPMLIELWNTITEIFSGIGTAIKDAFFNAIETVKGWLTNFILLHVQMAQAIKEAFFNALGAVKEKFAEIGTAIKDAFSNALDTVKEKFSSVFNGIKTFVSGIIESIIGIFDTLFKPIDDLFTALLNVIDKINIVGKAKEIFSNITDFLGITNKEGSTPNTKNPIQNSRRNTSVNNNTTVNVTIPNGTPAEVKKSIEDTANAVYGNSNYRGVWGNSVNGVPGMEAY